jgi:hypothetical protein
MVAVEAFPSFYALCYVNALGPLAGAAAATKISIGVPVVYRREAT